MDQKPPVAPQLDDVSLASSLMFQKQGDKALESIKKMPDVTVTSPNGHTLLGSASAWGCVDVVTYLVEDRKVPSDSRNGALMTPLMEACVHGQVNVARLLIAYQADVNAKSRAEDTPLIFAVEGGSLETVQLLISHGADKDYVQPSTGFSLSKIASLEGYTDIVKFLDSI